MKYSLCMLIAGSAGIKVNDYRGISVGETVLWQNEFVQTGAGDYSHDWESNSTIEPYFQRDHAWNNEEFDMSDEAVWHNETMHEYAGEAHVFNVTAVNYTYANHGWPYKTEVNLNPPTFAPGELHYF